MDALTTIRVIGIYHEERGEELDFIVCNTDVYQQILKQCRDLVFDPYGDLTPPMLTRVFGIPIRNINHGY